MDQFFPLLLTLFQAVLGTLVQDRITITIDLDSGAVQDSGTFPGYIKDVRFLVAPSEAHGDRCSRQAVLRLDMSDYNKAKIQVTYGEPKQWTLHVADSPGCDGYGGDNGVTGNMAEAHVANKQLRVYGNSLPGYHSAAMDGNHLLKVVDDFVAPANTVSLEVSDEKLTWGKSKRTRDFMTMKFLFTLSGQSPSYGRVDDYLYIGLNRVVRDPYRNGTGACSAIVTMQKSADRCGPGGKICSPYADCIVTRKSAKCKCVKGFYGNGKVCHDENECQSSYQGSQCVHMCTNFPGGFTCSCLPGFQLSSDGVNCEDINECAIGNGGCEEGCTNHIGGFTCSCTSSGMYLQRDGRTCDPRTLCHRQLGCEQLCETKRRGGQLLRSCDCRPGYRLITNRKCQATCVKDNGKCHHICTDDELRGPQCTCRPHYQLQTDGHTCRALCSLDNGGCGSICMDSARGPVCSCSKGFILNPDGKTCSDIDECAPGKDGHRQCRYGCVNTRGSFECMCPSGFRSNSKTKDCEDIDECSDKSRCDYQCVNTVGSYHCVCPAGLSLYGKAHCADVNECSRANGGCAASCENLDGSFQCHCPPSKLLHINGKDCLQTVQCRDLQAKLTKPICSPLEPYVIGECFHSACSCSLDCREKTPSLVHLLSYPVYFLQCSTLSEASFCSAPDLQSPVTSRKIEIVAGNISECAVRDSFREDVQKSLAGFLAGDTCQTVSCAIKDVDYMCGNKRKKYASMGDSLVTVTFTVSLQLKSSAICDGEKGKKGSEKVLKKLLRTWRMLLKREGLAIVLGRERVPFWKQSLKAGPLMQNCSSGHMIHRSICVPCLPGMFKRADSGECEHCPFGSYQKDYGQDKCSPCSEMDAGRPYGATNEKHCADICPAGRFSVTGLQPCTPCMVDTYQPDRGRSKCEPCGASLTTPNLGSSSFAQCVPKSSWCSLGEHYEAGSCLKCKKGFYQPQRGQNYCVQCPGNTTTDGVGSTRPEDCKDHSCGGILTADRGYITSPNWPGDYPANITCTWEIVPVERKRQILLVVPEVGFSRDIQCSDRLIMRKNASPLSAITYETCKSIPVPLAFTARSQRLWIQFTSDGTGHGRGFSIPYVTYETKLSELMSSILRDSRMYSLPRHRRLLQDRRLLSLIMEVIADPAQYEKYGPEQLSLLPPSFIEVIHSKFLEWYESGQALVLPDL